MKFLIGFDCLNYPVYMSGGMTVLKKLAKDLIQLGQKVYVINPQFNVEGSILVSKEQVKNIGLDDLVTIYPEIIPDNPFNSKNVVRWILYNTKPEIEKNWSPTDVYFYFNEVFTTTRNEDRKLLTCIDFNLDLFYDKNQERNGFCHIARYHKPNIPDFLLKDKYNSEDLFQGHMMYGWNWLVDKLNTKKYFITYDKATYYSAIAAMCGCTSIILSDTDKKHFDKEKIITHKYGIAYGFDEIEESIKTRNLLKPYLKELDGTLLDTVKKFISFWKSKV